MRDESGNFKVQIKYIFRQNWPTSILPNFHLVRFYKVTLELVPCNHLELSFLGPYPYLPQLESKLAVALPASSLCSPPRWSRPLWMIFDRVVKDLLFLIPGRGATGVSPRWKRGDRLTRSKKPLLFSTTFRRQRPLPPNASRVPCSKARE